MEDEMMEWFRRYQKSGSDTTWRILDWRITLIGCWIWSEKANDTSGTEMEWMDRQKMRKDSWYTHDLRLTTQERMNVLANHQTTHKDELADHQINKPVYTNELAKEISLSLREKKKQKYNSNLDSFYS